jgi:hypothetical protein
MQLNIFAFQVRIRSEHLVGMVKGCFQCLKGLRQLIRSPQDQALALEMAHICLVLHNLILEVENVPDDVGEWPWVKDGMDDDAKGLAEAVVGFGAGCVDAAQIPNGVSKRAHVHAVLFEELYRQ